MQVEHFIYGSFPKIGYQFIASSLITELLPKNYINFLTRCNGKLSYEVRIQHYFPSRNIVAISCIRPATDEYNRECTWNHTFVLTEQQYTELQHPVNLEPHYARLMTYQKTLQPVEVISKDVLATQQDMDYLAKLFGEARLKTILNVVSCSWNGFSVKIATQASPNVALNLIYTLLKVLPNRRLSFTTCQHSLTPPELDYALCVYSAEKNSYRVKFANGMEYPI